MTNYTEFYKSYTASLEAWALAERADQGAGYPDAMERMEVKALEGFHEGMAHAFMLITGHELDDSEYETTCDDFECDGSCNKNYCLNIYKNCEHELEDEYSCSQHSPVYPFVPEAEEPCYELRCSHCNEVTLHEERATTP